jgi:hypothetical protein
MRTPINDELSIRLSQAVLRQSWRRAKREKRRRDREAERLRGFEIDDEFEFGWLDDRQVGRLFALENEPSVCADQSKDIGKVRSIARQAAGFGPFTCR